MRHGFSKRRLNRTPEHRKSMFGSMACSLVEHERIKTTLPKAKELRPIIEKLVTLARADSLHARRLLLSRLHNNKAVSKKLCKDIAPRFANRQGGYTRIMKAGFRYGDAAPMAIIEFVTKSSSTNNESITKEENNKE